MHLALLEHVQAPCIGKYNHIDWNYGPGLHVGRSICKGNVHVKQKLAVTTAPNPSPPCLDTTNTPA